MVVLGVAALVGAYVARNPERDDLDDEARRGVPGQFARLSDGVTHYEVSGPVDGRAVVLVHGFSVPYYIWDSTATLLSQAGYRVLRYDLYGRGWSDRPKTAYDAALFDRQLAELLDTVGARGPVDVFGLSMGGWVIATFAERHPERVRSLTFIDPVAGPAPAPLPLPMRVPLLSGYLFQVAAVPGMAQGQITDFADTTHWTGWDDLYRPQMRFRGFGRALLSTRRALQTVHFDSLYERVGRRPIPVLLIWGTEDQTVPFAFSDGVRAAMPGAEFHAIKGAGHLPHLERASEVNPLLLDFLRRVETPSPPVRP